LQNPLPKQWRAPRSFAGPSFCADHSLATLFGRFFACTVVRAPAAQTVAL
jgi:hypothetical protein